MRTLRKNAKKAEAKKAATAAETTTETVAA